MKLQVLNPVLVISILLSLFPMFSFSQIHSDCINALQLGGTNTLEIDLDSFSIDENLDVVNIEACTVFNEDIFEYGLWYKLEVESSGDVIFDIIPIEDRDIDFLLFRSTDGTCDNLELIRCMTSGETIGQSLSNNEPCMGPTGLSYEAEDTEEAPGCTDGSDNYLASVDVAKGELLYLVIFDFFFKNDINYLIRPGGTARLKD